MPQLNTALNCVFILHRNDKYREHDYTVTAQVTKAYLKIPQKPNNPEIKILFNIYCDNDRLSRNLYHPAVAGPISPLLGIAGSEDRKNQSCFHLQNSPLS